MSNEVVLGKSVHTPSPKDFRYLRESAHAAEHPCSLELLAYWRQCEDRGGMRMGRDLPSRAVAKLLPNIAVTEPIDGWADGHIRLAGLVYLERFGRDITGMNIRQLYAGDSAGADAILAGARHCAEHHCPTVLHTQVLAESTELMRFEVLALPIFAPGNNSVWNLAGTFRF